MIQAMGNRLNCVLRRTGRLLLVPLALVFLLESWLWDRLAPVVAAVVAAVPMEPLRRRLSARIERMSRYGALALFLSPLLLGIPVKCAEVLLAMHGHWIGVVAVLLAAKIVGMGLLAFIFEQTRDKVLTIGWFRVCYDLALRTWRASHALVDPLVEEIKKLRGHATSDFRCFLKRLRRRSLTAYRACNLTPAA